ncbi:hypothetical protein PK98_14640 [Croceibacterium mercuriale]|uniref:Uncharacterized protein n=1 Tax=Croceibacterium mercuriale TaxID=1572751 RepID=A0A0B2BWA3_9SPHN|nr:hypothetical protein PK98_14640 [Croceibacterium mercuriale]
MDDAALVSSRPEPSTVAFYVAFALWLTATGYGGSGFYAGQLAPVVQDVLSLALFAGFLIVVALVIRRSLRAAAFPWLDIAVVAGAFVGFELVWRYCRPLAWDAFKFASLSLDMAAPLVVALGLKAASAELGWLFPKTQGPTM